MFLLHPKIAKQLNTKSIYTPFAPEGLKGSTGDILHTQQVNRLIALGQQSLASSGGTASLCGGAAGPGGGPAGAGGGAFSGAHPVVAGGSNGACGGVPIGGQEIGRFYYNGTYHVSDLIIDDVEEIAPLTPPEPPAPLMRSSLELSSVPLDTDPRGLYSGMGSVGGTGTSDMTLLSQHPNKNRTNKTGGPTSCSTKK